ncbi:MAG TPA: sulfurtransferase [Gemmatimonadaceae bacterium]|nr:sulfurtransferase [Gemmatimonadaceae bacterium]
MPARLARPAARAVPPRRHDAASSHAPAHRSTASRLPRTLRRLVAAATLAWSPLAAQDRPAPDVPLIVTGDWLARHLGDTRQAILHAASARAEYDAGHVPGARLLLFSSYAPTLEGLSSQMPPAAQLDSLLESVGVNDGDRLVIYGQPLQVARLLVTLEHLGLKGRVSVLDGGIDAWREGGSPLSREAPAVTRGAFTPRVDPSVIADVTWLSRNTATPGVRILDARAPEFYLGYSPGQMPRAGHIPNAMNLPFSQLTGELTRLRDQPRLSRLFAEAGVKPGDTVVTYCHIGMQASLLYFAARRAGLNARLYDGSWEEWSKTADLPIVTVAGSKP